MQRPIYLREDGGNMFVLNLAYNVLWFYVNMQVMVSGDIICNDDKHAICPAFL